MLPLLFLELRLTSCPDPEAMLARFGTKAGGGSTAASPVFFNGLFDMLIHIVHITTIIVMNIILGVVY